MSRVRNHTCRTYDGIPVNICGYITARIQYIITRKH